MSDIFERINIIAENIHNAIDDYVKDPEKREQLSNRAHDIQQADDPDQKRFMEKNVHKISGHGKEYQKHNGPYTADYPNTGVYSGMDVDKTVDHLMNIAKSKAEDRYYKRRAKNRRFEKKINKNESLQEHLYHLIESFSNLFEVEGLGNPAVDVPPSQNKIKKDRKTKDGKVEVVSVEDELFPYDGNKREQYRQKILDTINGMIQGTATLEDLLQIVRQKKAPLKEAMELMEDINNYVRRVHGEPNEVNKSGKLLDKAASIKMREHNKAAGKAAADKLGISMDDEEWWKDENNRKKYQKEFEKQAEEIFKKRKVKNYKTIPNSADFVHGKGWTGEPLQKKAPLKEAMEVLESIISEYTEEDRKEAAKKVLDDRKREYLSKYANVLDAADIDGSENVPDGDMKDLERAEKRYKHAKKVANEAFEEALKILELFDRPDLLNDIDTAVGSPVKKAFKKAMSSIAAPKKEKKVKECKK